MANEQPATPPSPSQPSQPQAAAGSPPSSSRPRRGSVTELFTRQANGGAAPPPRLSTSASNASGGGPLFPAAANPHHQRRRTSITTLGLSGSPTQSTSAAGFGNVSPSLVRRASVSSSVMSTSPHGSNNNNHHNNSNGSGTEEAVLEEVEPDTGTQPTSASTSPTKAPFARRVSFGTQALRERAGNRASNGEGFNWPEALRTRAERAPSFGSFSQTSPPHGQTGTSPSQQHQRATSVASMDMSQQKNAIPESQPIQPQPQPQPPPQQQQQQQQQKPQQPRQRPKPDYFQEKILRADFMD